MDRAMMLDVVELCDTWQSRAILAGLGKNVVRAHHCTIDLEVSSFDDGRSGSNIHGDTGLLTWLTI